MIIKQVKIISKASETKSFNFHIQKGVGRSTTYLINKRFFSPPSSFHMYSSCFSPLFSSSEKKNPTNNTEHLVVTISSHPMVIFEKCIHLFDKKKKNTMA